MRKDLFETASVGNPNATIPELTVDQIRTYHTDVFRDNGNIPAYAWTAYWPTVLARDGLISGYTEASMWAALQNQGAFSVVPDEYTAQFVNGGLMTSVMALQYATYYGNSLTGGLSTAQQQAMAHIKEWLVNLVPGLIESTLTVPKIYGSGQQDMLVGGALSSAFYPGSGGDLVIGNGPADQVRYSDAPQGINIDFRLTGNNVIADGWGFSDRLIQVEVVYGSAKDDKFAFSRSVPNMALYGDLGSDVVTFQTPLQTDKIILAGLAGTAFTLTATGQSAVRLEGIEKTILQTSSTQASNLIPTPIAQNPYAHFLIPIDMMRQG